MVYAASPGQRHNHQFPVFVLKTINIKYFQRKTKYYFYSAKFFLFEIAGKDFFAIVCYFYGFKFNPYFCTPCWPEGKEGG